MNLSVNDQPYELCDGGNLHSLIEALGYGGQTGIAVAVNATVIPSKDWEQLSLSDGDAVLVIQATQGG